MDAVGGGVTGLLAKLRPVLERVGLDAEAIDYRRFGLEGEGDACHAVVADWTGRTVAEAWGPTPDAALAEAVRELRPLDD